MGTVRSGAVEGMAAAGAAEGLLVTPVEVVVAGTRTRVLVAGVLVVPTMALLVVVPPPRSDTEAADAVHSRWSLTPAAARTTATRSVPLISVRVRPPETP